MNWYIGQEIVAVRDHPQGVFKEGDTFVIKGLRGSPCKCHSIDIDVGIKSSGGHSLCGVCGYRGGKNGLYWWFSEQNFAPLDTICDISELMDVLERPIFS